VGGEADSGEGDIGEEGEGQVVREGAGAVVSAQAFDVSLLSEKEFDEQVGKFLDDHILKVEKEIAQVIDDQFESKFEF